MVAHHVRGLAALARRIGETLEAVMTSMQLARFVGSPVAAVQRRAGRRGACGSDRQNPFDLGWIAPTKADSCHFEA